MHSNQQRIQLASQKLQNASHRSNPHPSALLRDTPKPNIYPDEEVKEEEEEKYQSQFQDTNTKLQFNLRQSQLVQPNMNNPSFSE